MKIIKTIFVCALFTLSVYAANAQIQNQQGEVGGGHQNDWKTEGTINVHDPEGSVSGGHQNDWKPEGTIKLDDADGAVGGGHQNDWKPEGTINSEDPKEAVVTFIKAESTNRNSNSCWNAGTPVEWDQDVQLAKAITADVNGVDMLVSRDAMTREIIKYHPLITFQNEIIFQIMKDGHKDWLENLERETNAIKLWRYLEEKYLDPSLNALATQTGGTVFQDATLTQAQGEVGGGHQNEWKPEGTIYTDGSNLLLTFTKTESTSRNDNACWNAGTPVGWDQDVQKAWAIRSDVDGVDMLVSKNPTTNEITEYHPLITLYNEITFQIIKDGHKDWLENSENETNAIKLWRYLEGKYLN